MHAQPVGPAFASPSIGDSSTPNAYLPLTSTAYLACHLPAPAAYLCLLLYIGFTIHLHATFTPLPYTLTPASAAIPLALFCATLLLYHSPATIPIAIPPASACDDVATFRTVVTVCGGKTTLTVLRVRLRWRQPNTNAWRGDAVARYNRMTDANRGDGHDDMKQRP